MMKKLFEEKAYEFEIIKNQLKDIDIQLKNLTERLSQLKLAKETIEGLKDSVKNEQVLIPIGEGLFIKARKEDNKTILMNVGSDILIEKDFIKVNDYIDKRLEEVNNLIHTLNKNGDLFVTRMRNLETELNELQKQQTQQKQN